MVPSAVVMVVPLVAAVDRDDRVVVAVIQIFRGGRLVVVAVKVSGAHETAGFCRVADTAVPRQRRVGADRARKESHATYDLGRYDLVRRDALLDPLREWRQHIGAVWPSATVAVRHSRLEEQPCEFLCAMQVLLSPSLIVPALAALTCNQSFVIIDGVQRRYHWIG